MCAREFKSVVAICVEKKEGASEVEGVGRAI